MLVAGAGGLASQLYDDLLTADQKNIVFWSEVETKYAFIKERFAILKNDEEVIDFFSKTAGDFILAIGSMEHRKSISDKFKNLGGNIVSFVSPRSVISPYTTIGNGTVILSRVEVEASTIIGEECLLNKTCNIGHGCIIGNNCEIAPGVILSGEVILGANTFVGMRAIILPKVKIGKNVTIAAGSIVKKNVPDNAVMAGEFATIKFYKKPC